MKTILKILLALAVVSACETACGQQQNIREATAAEVSAGTLGLPAVITPRRLKGAGAGGVVTNVIGISPIVVSGTTISAPTAITNDMPNARVGNLFEVSATAFPTFRLTARGLAAPFPSTNFVGINTNGNFALYALKGPSTVRAGLELSNLINFGISYGNAGGMSNLQSAGLALSSTNTANSNNITGWYQMRDVSGNYFWVPGVNHQP